MDPGPDPDLVQRASKRVAVGDAHRVQVVDALGARVLDQGAAGSWKQLSVERRPRPSRGVSGVELAELDPQHRGLEPVEPFVEARLDVLSLGPLAEVAEATAPLGDRIVVGTDRAAVAERAEVLARIEAERRDMAEGAGPRPFPAGPVGLGGVLHDQQAVSSRESLHGVHVACLAVQVDGNDRHGSR